ncbi:MAG: D-alanine--D-alanine ligase [Treponema sp.]|nr:D-alanine--D-alanine ligase [Treponema sp.]
MNIAVIYGGKSGEHEVSCISASSVARNIDTTKHTVVLIGITKDGRWYKQSQALFDTIKKDEKAVLTITEEESQLISIIPGAEKGSFAVQGKSLDIDVVFPVLHGTYGEDGTIQGLFEMADIPYVGCGVMASSVTMDKEKTKQIWAQAGLPIVPYMCMRRSDLNDSAVYDALFQKAIDTLGFPLFIKPCCAGSSNGASRANTPKEFSMALMDAFQWDDKVLIEKAISAREIECSVTGNATTASADCEAEQVKAYIPGEIIPTHTFYDYDAKYTDPDGAALQIPANLSKEQIEQVRSIAIKAYTVLDAAGLSRVDFFIDKNDGTLYLNEINTMPGFTSISMFPKMCEAAGLTFTPLTELLITEAIKRYADRKALRTSL